MDRKEQVHHCSPCAAHLGPVNSLLLLFVHGYRKATTRDSNDIVYMSLGACTEQFNQLSSCGQASQSHPLHLTSFFGTFLGFATHLNEKPSFAGQY